MQHPGLAKERTTLALTNTRPGRGFAMHVQVMKSIIAFYTKAKAHLQLSDFYDACAQVCHIVTVLKRECGMEGRVLKGDRPSYSASGGELSRTHYYCGLHLFADVVVFIVVVIVVGCGGVVVIVTLPYVDLLQRPRRLPPHKAELHSHQRLLNPLKNDQNGLA